jgi:hypothetical protein
MSKDCAGCVDCGTNTREIKEPIVYLIKAEIRDKIGLPHNDGVIQGSLCLRALA